MNIGIETLPSLDLVQKYNLAANFLGEKNVKRFSDKKAAIRRTIVMVGRYEEAKAPAPKKNARAKRFVFKPEDTIKGCSGSPDKPSLRAQCVELLLKGATLPQVDDLVKRFDAQKGKETDLTTLTRRTYGLVRLLHFYLGYGLREEVNGAGHTVIFAYTN